MLRLHAEQHLTEDDISSSYWNEDCSSHSSGASFCVRRELNYFLRCCLCFANGVFENTARSINDMESISSMQTIDPLTLGLCKESCTHATVVSEKQCEVSREEFRMSYRSVTDNNGGRTNSDIGNKKRKIICSSDGCQSDLRKKSNTSFSNESSQIRLISSESADDKGAEQATNFIE